MKKAEITLIITAIIGVILSFIPVPGGNILTILSITFLACMYFYFGFALFNGIRFRDIFKKASYQGISALRIVVAIAVGMCISTALTGIEFRLMMWEGTAVMLLVGSFSVCLMTIVAVIKYATGKSPFYLNILKRSVPYTLLAITFYMLPGYAILELKYRNHPEYVEAVKAVDADPSNEELQEKVMQERARLEGEHIRE